MSKFVKTARYPFTLLILFSSLAFSAAALSNSDRAYQQLLNNCGKEIQSTYPASKMQLVKKIYSSTQHRFWISISQQGDNIAKAYCVGKTRTGEIEQFAIGAGEWNGQHWLTDAAVLLSKKVAQN